MASKLPPVVFDEENPEWSADDFARARPAGEVLPAAVLDAFAPADSEESNTELVTLWLDADVVAKFQAAGGDWEARINAVLRDADPWTLADRDAA